MRQINKILISNTNNLEYSEAEKMDISKGYETIFCHYFINEKGEIIKCCDESVDAGTTNSALTDYIVIKYVSQATGTCKNFKQVLAIYAILYDFYKRGFDFSKQIVFAADEIVSNHHLMPKFKNTYCSTDITWLFQLNDNAVKEFRSVLDEINRAEQEANWLVDSGQIKTIQDVHKSKYKKTYDAGIVRYMKIIKKHNTPDEFLEISKETVFIRPPGYPRNVKFYVSKSLYEFIMNNCKGNPMHFYNTLYNENTMLRYMKPDFFVKRGSKKYIHIIKLFNCWNLIKKTYPSSKTINVISKYKNKDTLTQDELKKYLKAYILLSWEVKTIKDYNPKTLLDDIYDAIVLGTYVSGQNYVCEGFQINIRNAQLYHYRNLIIS